MESAGSLTIDFVHSFPFSEKQIGYSGIEIERIFSTAPSFHPFVLYVIVISGLVSCVRW